MKLHFRQLLAYRRAVSIFWRCTPSGSMTICCFTVLPRDSVSFFASAIFLIAWNARAFLNNNYLIVMGVACLFVAGIDFFHTLAFKG